MRLVRANNIMKLYTIVVLVVFVFGINAEDVLEETKDVYLKDALQFIEGCGSKEMMLCFKETAMSYVENLPNNLIIGGGLTIKSNEDGADRSARLHNIAELPEEPRAREDAIDKILTDRILNYLSSHTIEFKVPDGTVNEFKRSIEEARKKKKKNGMMGIMMLMKLKAAALAAIALKTLAVLSFKALLIAKVALTIMVIIGLKKLAESKSHHSSTYEVVAHDDHHGHYRSLDGHDLAYRAYKEDFTTQKNS